MKRSETHRSGEADGGERRRWARPDRVLAGVVIALVLALATAPLSSAQVSFRGPTSFGVGQDPASVAVGDFNGDSHLDLVAANASSGTVSVLLGDGTGGFGAATDFDVGVFAFAVAVGDFNGDTHPDLAVASFNFSPPTGVWVLLGDGTGGFGAASLVASGSAPSMIAVGDFNGDSDLDLAAGNFFTDVFVLLGDGTGGFGAESHFGAGTSPSSIAVGDLDGDSHLDLAVSNSFSGDVSVLRGNGSGGFGAARNFTVGISPRSVAVGDLNGDSHLDLVAANQGSNNVSVLLGDGSGGYGAATGFATGEGPWSVAIGDLDGDSHPDLTVANRSSTTISVLLGDGSGGFGAATDFGAGSGPNSVALGDLDEDGDPDVAVAAQLARSVAVLLTNQVPRAAADRYTTDHDTAVSVDAPGVLANDADPEGDDLTAAVVSGPGHGTATLDADGSFTYTPAAGFSGSDSFTYRANDGNADSSAATVTITVNPPPPSPPPPPPAPPPAPPPPSAPPAVMRVQAPSLSVFGRSGSRARCRMRTGRIGSCTVRLRAGGRVLARGAATSPRTDRRQLMVTLRLTAPGRALLARRLGGVRTRVRARGATSGGARRATARTRAILRNERFTTPAGSWTPNQATLTASGRKFVRGLRGKLIAVATVRCDGHDANVRATSTTTSRLSLARAAAMCDALRRLAARATPRLVGHGNAQPIASNATASGRAKNRRVEVTITHRR